MPSFGSFYTINEGPKNDLSIKNQAVFEEKFSAQHILLLASQGSRKMSHWAGRVQNGGEIFVFPVDHSGFDANYLASLNCTFFGFKPTMQFALN